LFFGPVGVNQDQRALAQHDPQAGEPGIVRLRALMFCSTKLSRRANASDKFCILSSRNLVFYKN
jgi:hypothetical protein